MIEAIVFIMFLGVIFWYLFLFLLRIYLDKKRCSIDDILDDLPEDLKKDIIVEKYKKRKRRD